MKSYRGFPERLHHRVPHWVEPGALFHIRIRLDREKQQRTLIDPSLAPALLDSAKFYERTMRWHIKLFLLMPDHVHAVLSFPRDKLMSEVIRDWKRFHTRTHRVMWQEGYFDHRLRPDERGTQFSAKLNYIRQNPCGGWFMRQSRRLALGYRSFRERRWIGLSSRRSVLIRRRRRYTRQSRMC